MKNIIDVPEGDPAKPIYLSKSGKICRLYLALLILAFILSSLAKESDTFSTLLTILLGISLFILFSLSPWGVYYVWKSKKTGEGNSRKRLGHAILHWFIFVLLMLVIVRFVMDVIVILKQ